MTKRISHLAVAAFVAIATATSPALGQSLASRIASAADRSVQFSYPARPGVCGDGRTYISTGSGNFYGSFSTNAADPCQPGPVRVGVDLVDKTVVALRYYVGAPPAAVDAGVTNLGSVTPTDAADYLLGIASRADGRVGRDAIFAALLGDN